MKAALYLRVSSASQVGGTAVSLDNQEMTNQHFGEAQGGPGAVKYILVDPAKSGRNPDREQYRRLVELCRAGEVDTVIVYMLDRIGRDEAEYFILMRQFKAWGVRLLSVMEPWLNDNPFAAGMSMLGAAQESQKISMRVKPAQLRKLEAGLHVGRTPLGYDTFLATKLAKDGRPINGYDLKPNAEQRVVSWLFDTYAEGELGLGPLSIRAKAEGLAWKGIAKSNLSRLLSNPVYLGYKTWSRHRKVADEDGHQSVVKQPKSEWFVGDEVTHPALVSQETFDRVQAILARNRVQGCPRPPRPRQMLVGLAWCTCGARISVNSAHGYSSYGCSRRRELGKQACSEPYVMAHKVDAVVKAVVDGALVRLENPEYRALVLAGLAERGADALEREHGQRRNLEASYTLVTNDLKEGTLKMIRGELTPEQFAVVEPDLRATQARLEALLAELPEEPALPDYTVTLRELQLANTNRSQWGAADWRQFLGGVVERVTLVAGTPQVDFKPLVREIVLESAAIRI